MRIRYEVKEVLGYWEVRDSEGRLCWIAQSKERADCVASFLSASILHPGAKAWVARHQEENIDLDADELKAARADITERIKRISEEED